MFKHTLNRAVVRLRFETVSPLLIRAGDTGLDPARADLSCVRTRHATLGTTVYIPGSSAKGVIRSAAEALIRGLGPKMACDPLDHRSNCVASLDRKLPTAALHAGHCLACRLFGSTRLRGRCAIRDLFPFAPGEAVAGEDFARANRVEARNGVGIDRISGAVRVGPFDFEMVPAGARFFGDVALVNVQAWQLGLLAAGLRALDEGAVQLGSTKSRGLGVVRVAIDEVLFEQSARGPARPVGVGELVAADERRAYALRDERALPSLPGTTTGLTRRFVVAGPDAAKWLWATEEALAVLA